jgi:hypothetical protein
VDRAPDITAGVGARATAYVDRGRAGARHYRCYLVPLAPRRWICVRLASASGDPVVGPFSVGAGYTCSSVSRFGRDVGRVTRQYPGLRLFISRSVGIGASARRGHRSIAGRAV